MPLPEKSFDELVSDQVNAMQAVAQRLLDFSTGSVMLAIVESNAGNSIWLEALVAYLLSITRLQTSHGENVDTFVEQFGLYRLPATPAFGEVTFSRSDTSQAAVIQAGELDLSTQGQLVYSPSNQITYSVYADPDNPAYNPDINAYVLIVGNESVTVPVVALTPGSVGNVLAGQITIISTPINYVSSVTNENSFATGQDQESDAALKLRFVLYINSLSKATEQSLEETIESVPGVARYNLVENEDIDGNDDIGFFYAVIDDGSGNASPELLANVQLAVYADRGLTIAFSIYEPEQLEV
ncbi:MAG: baseplate J/gp47 family protein, partial [Pseudomonadota bacterium]